MIHQPVTKGTPMVEIEGSRVIRSSEDANAGEIVCCTTPDQPLPPLYPLVVVAIEHPFLVCEPAPFCDHIHPQTQYTLDPRDVRVIEPCPNLLAALSKPDYHTTLAEHLRRVVDSYMGPGRFRLKFELIPCQKKKSWDGNDHPSP